MQERELRSLIEDVRCGALPRRSFIQTMVGLGLTAPMASMMLMHEGVAQTPAPIPYKPTKRGGGGTLKLIWWQGAVHLNPHFAGGTKEQDATRIFYEPLAGWDTEGNLIPMLATEIPTRQNGGVAADGLSSIAPPTVGGNYFINGENLFGFGGCAFCVNQTVFIVACLDVVIGETLDGAGGRAATSLQTLSSVTMQAPAADRVKLFVKHFANFVMRESERFAAGAVN